MLSHRRNWLDDFGNGSNNFENEKGYFFGHYETGLSLQSFATEGCMFCLHLWDQLTNEEREVVLNVDGEGFVSQCMLNSGEQVDMRSCFILGFSMSD